MIPTSRTCIVFNSPNKLLGLPEYYYRKRSCDTNMTSNTPANQYQKLKLIQNTVRVHASLYTSNLGSLSAYQNPGVKTHNVCWNQMSDRVYPSVQKAVIPSGTNSALNKRNTSVTSSRPGCQAPGGVGCDIKHNSYDRYLNRLKGKGVLRRGVVPQNFGVPTIPFNPAYPVYGGKTTKTNIVSGCDCPIVGTNTDINNNTNTVNVTNIRPSVMTLNNNIQIYNNPLYQDYPVGQFQFNIGEYVFAIQSGNTYYTRAIIEKVLSGSNYLVLFDNGLQETHNIGQLLIYYPCNCNGMINSQTYPSGFLVVDAVSSNCLYPIYVPGEPVI